MTKFGGAAPSVLSWAQGNSSLEYPDGRRFRVQIPHHRWSFRQGNPGGPVVTNAVFAGEATPQEAAALNEMMKAHLYSGCYAELGGCATRSDAKKPKREQEEEAEE